MFESAGLLELVTDACGLAVVGADCAGLVRFWSRSAERLLGWPAAEMIGQPLSFLWPIDGRGSKEPLDAHLQLSIRTKDEEEIWVEVREMSWPAAPGTPEGTVCVLRNVTLERSEEEAARAGRRFRELLEAAPDAILEIDGEGKIVLANAIAEQMFGYSRADLVGLSVDNLLPEGLRSRHVEHRRHYHANPRTRPMGSGLKLEAVRRNGELFPVEISLSPVEGEGGIRITAIVRDISERRAAEQKLQETRERFARELALKNEELERRNREVERSNQLKSEFLASMSHELRTPLHTIIGFSELLSEQLQGPLNGKQQRFVDHILNDSLHLLELINDILDLSRIESGRLTLKLERFNVSAPLEDAVASVRPRAAQKMIQIDVAPAGAIELDADRLRFKEILLNLLSNAVKFTPEHGQVLVEMAMENDSPFCRFTVSDTGIGIPQSEQEAIFDKFYQTGSTTRGIREGTGLGLAITRHLVEAHGGRVWVESTPGHGSRFSFTMPAAAANLTSNGGG
jgi:PAS domain S-box-containing protein